MISSTIEAWLRELTTIYPAIRCDWTFVTDHANSLHAEEVAALVGAVPKRRKEFSTGRVLARALMGHIDGFAGQTIPKSESGAPEWPAGLVGSLTHVDGVCAAMIGRSTEYAGLGLDLERIDAVDLSVRDRVLTRVERQRPGDLAADLHLALCFSAKEAVFKTLHPLAGEFKIGRAHV